MAPSKKVAPRRTKSPKAASVELSEAPWFRLSHYSGVKDWSLVDWFSALSNRLGVKHWIDNPLPGATPMDIVRTHFESIGKNPIAPAGTYWSETGRTSPFMLAVSKTEAAKELVRIPPVVQTDLAMAQYWQEHLGDEHRLLIVDLAASNESLVAAFSKWLKLTRSTTRRGLKSITATDMELWTNSRVIPFIDLSLYGRAIGKPLAPATIAEAIFRDDDNRAGIDFAERLRKGTKKHFKRLFSQQMLNRMAAQIGAQSTFASQFQIE